MTITAEAPIQTETLVCSNCGEAWQREVTRGRKPRFCEDCVRMPLGRRQTPAPVTPIHKVSAPRKHKAFSTLLAIAMARKNTMLVGPAGSGKSTAGRQVSEALGLSFATESCNPQMSKWDIMGFMGATGEYVPGVVREPFENGGVLLLDEMDASNPQVLVSINLIASAKIGETVTFPDGANVERHPDFILVAGCNTFGDGASDQYVGREQLDAATLDRFMTIAWDYDEDVERIASGHDEWSGYVQRVRKAIELAGVDHLVTPRASIDGADLLRAGIARSTVEDVALWKGLDADSKRTVLAQMRNM